MTKFYTVALLQKYAIFKYKKKRTEIAYKKLVR
jgi:hypothetical protein